MVFLKAALKLAERLRAEGRTFDKIKDGPQIGKEFEDEIFQGFQKGDFKTEF